MPRPDPYRAFRFRVELAGLELGGFQSVSGIERETKIEPYREGGINDYEHQHATLTTYPPLTLKRGLVDTALWDWHQAVIMGVVLRLPVSVVLLDEAGDEAWRWVATNAFPAKWTGAELDSTASTLATEAVELVHHGLWRL